MADQYRDRPFPADDYGRDSFGRDSLRVAAQPPQGDSDPLAELARLIGQADPFSTYARDQKAGAARPAPARHEPVQHDQYAEPETAYAPDSYEEEAEPAAAQPAPPSWVQNLNTSLNTAWQPREPSFREDDRYDLPLADDGYEPAQAYREPQFDHGDYDPLPLAPAANQSASPSLAGDRYDDVLYGPSDHQREPVGGHGQDRAYDDAYGQPAYDDGYEPDEQRPRRGGTMTVVVVLLLAVVGTGAAFAYRTFIGSPRSGEPPVIKADTSPNKVIPPGQGDTSGKQIYDRVGDKSTERVVSREEQPVDINARTNPNAGPRVVFPPLTQNTNPPTPASASTAARPTGAGVGNGTLNGEEPRRIRTLSIRPDQADAQASAAPVSPPPAASASRTQTPAPRAQAPAVTGATNASGPISLSPQAAPAADTRQKVASVNPTAAAAPAAGGAYVQVSSQKSEADAKASFKALQGKYAGILGARTASIHRVEIAGKGVFYRAMVGPFASGDEAVQLCTSLKSAGGQCVIQRN